MEKSDSRSDEEEPVKETLAYCVQKMYDDRADNGDVTIKIGNRRGNYVKAHRFILMCRSKVLSWMLDNQKKGDKTHVLKVNNISRETFTNFLEFLYTDNTTVTADNIEELLVCAKKYETPVLTEICKDSLTKIITTKTICKLIKIVELFNESEMIKICSEKFTKMRQECLLSLLNADGFLKMCSSCIFKIVEDDRSSAPEEVIFDWVVKWSEEECKRQKLNVTATNQRMILGDILKEVRFPTMRHQYLDDVVCPSKILTITEKYDILRQQLNTRSRNDGSMPSLFKCKKRWWHIKEVTTFKFSPSSKETSSPTTFSLTFNVSCHVILVGISLNIYYYPCYFKKNNTNIITMIKSPDGHTQEYRSPFSQCLYDRFFIRLCPPFIIPLNPNIDYTLSLFYESTSENMKSTFSGFMCRKVESIVHNHSWSNGKELTIKDAGQVSDIPFISGLHLA